MLAATAFSLLVPALDRGEIWEVLAGFALGCAVLSMGSIGRFRTCTLVLPSRVRGAARRCCS